MLFLPELTLLGAGLILFIFSLGQPSSGKVKAVATGLAALTFLISLLCVGSEGTLFYGAFQVDFFSQLFKVLITLGTLLILLFSATDAGVTKGIQSEYYLFLFMSVLGLMMLVSSVELLAIFVSLELSSFAVYIMVPMRKNSITKGAQIEAGIKYLLYGVVATGLMLFGMSYIYGLTGTTELSKIAPAMAELYTQPAAVIAILLVLAGFFYKLALFPLHFWVPDIYEGASNETTAFIAAIPKLAAVAMLIRLVNLVSGPGQVMATVLGVCAVLSMFYGNLSALVQKDIKRLLGFSGIAHAGFILLGLLTFQISGYGTAMYYIMGYLFMNLACFLVICTISEEGKNVCVEDFTGLHKRSPLLAITLTVGLFALAGIPPFVGFTGKFLLLLGALKQGHLIFVTLAAINTAIAIYYYLSIVRVTFCTDDGDRGTVTASPVTNGLAILLMLCIIVMGVLPGQFIEMTSTALKYIN
ncbi:MAG: NADH-quinone oxidoreductase subunit N [Desulfobulbaceae bacterium]|nr:NADH-quinone oxidoreductase subunit N [Desulfobulbaceae bacterium]